MVTEDYVSFDTAKLLKEKGFDEYCKSVYHVGSVCSVASLGYHNNEGYGEVIDEKQNSDFGKYDNAISAPTLQMTMKWLREKCISITLNITGFNLNDLPVWNFDIWCNNNHEYRSSDYFDSYEQACEAGIKYCLENLI